ncbi:hypothetical protein ACL9RF_17540 [Sphingobacterium sp. Mn56C]|uniref:hypothetical protein n=1 Tax=Sphingobacterium sp. Mn56C TaxID=3395261 RepID=UPI003BEE28C1
MLGSTPKYPETVFKTFKVDAKEIDPIFNEPYFKPLKKDADSFKHFLEAQEIANWMDTKPNIFGIKNIFKRKRNRAIGIDLKKIKYLFYMLIMCIVFFSCNKNRKTKEVDISTKTQQFKLIDSRYVEYNYLELIADSNDITSLKFSDILYSQDCKSSAKSGQLKL